jgi:hypothetical protein
MRLLSDGLAAYHAGVHDVWGENAHHNGWLRIEFRITTNHAADWRELHFGFILFFIPIPPHC